MKDLKSNLLNVIFFFLMGYGSYIYTNFEITTEYIDYYLMTSFIMFFPLFVKWIFFRKENKKDKKDLNIILKIFAVIIFPILIGFLLMNAISFHYTALFGKETVYLATVTDKEYKSERKRSHHYIRFYSDSGIEEIDDNETYQRVNIGSNIKVKKVISVVGS